VPQEIWIDFANIIVSGAIVAAIVLPLGLISWLTFRREAKPLLPHWLPWGGPWSGFEVVVAFLVIMIVIPAMINGALAKTVPIPDFFAHEMPELEASAAVCGMPVALAIEQRELRIAEDVRSLWASLIALPLQLCLLVGASKVLYPQWWKTTCPSFSSRILLAIIAWCVITPVAHMVNFGLNMLFVYMDWPTQVHPLAKLGDTHPFNSVLLIIFVQASVAAPIIEEIVFRGVILAWSTGSRRPQLVPDIPTRIRPWLVALAGLFFAGVSGPKGESIFVLRGPTILVLVLIALLAMLLRLFPRKRRTVGAVFSTAIFFAAVHSSFWPSPIPLFLLGLVLGWLAVKTRSLLVPIIVHGLFNAVSAVNLLRSAG
jgi:membrane protease YdiL (CAAX protease family)